MYFKGRLYFFHHSISVWSPKVQHITIPVPLQASTFSSAIIGTSILIIGIHAVLPIRCLFFSSLGLTNTETIAGNNSGLVVAIINSSFVSFVLNLI